MGATYLSEIQQRDAALMESSERRRLEPTTTYQAREKLWLAHHGTSMPLYGDDGRMDCSACFVDFRNGDLHELIRLSVDVMIARQRRMVEDRRWLLGVVAAVEGIVRRTVSDHLSDCRCAGCNIHDDVLALLSAPAPTEER